MPHSDYDRMERAIGFLEKNFRLQPGLGDVAKHIGLSEFHFQRLFTRWAGISPKKFLQFITLGFSKDLLIQSRSVLDTTYESGLSSPARLHDLFITLEAMTPGEYKNRGIGLVITYGFHSTPFGEVILAVTDRGICGMEFLAGEIRRHAIDRLGEKWERAVLREDSRVTQRMIEMIFGTSAHRGQRLSLLLKGTNFQIKVWEALLRIPPGYVLSYGDIAGMVGKPKASRAVGNAVSHNPIAYIIPCQRVIQSMGAFGEYHWGSTRKRAMLLWESKHSTQNAA